MWLFLFWKQTFLLLCGFGRRSNYLTSSNVFLCLFISFHGLFAFLLGLFCHLFTIENKMHPHVNCSGIAFQIEGAKVMVCATKQDLTLLPIVPLVCLLTNAMVCIHIPLQVSKYMQCLPRVMQKRLHMLGKVLYVND